MASRHLFRLAIAACAIGITSCGGVTVDTSTGGGTTTTAGGSAGTGAGGTSTTGTTGGSVTSTTGSGGVTSTGGTGGAACAPVFAITQCSNHVYECGDGVDNDGDGLTDWLDPECVGPCDNSENSFHHEIPDGDAVCVTECAFDANSGAGDDDCHWTHKCDPFEQTAPGHPEPSATCPYDANATFPGTNLTCSDMQAQQSPECHAFCGPLVPNGCDCFGCCELPAYSGNYVWLHSVDEDTWEGKCTTATIGDPEKCEPCTPVKPCLNTCDACELCLGQQGLPDDCPFQTCPDGVPQCGYGCQPPCPEDTYCVTGCCQPVPQ